MFHAAGDGSIETSCLAGISFTRANQLPAEDHYSALKGAVVDLAMALGQQQITFAPAPAAEAPWMGENHSMQICCREHVVGALGILAEPLRTTVAIEGQVSWFEINLEQLAGPLFPRVQYQPVPSYPESWQDFSLLWELAQGYAALEAQLASFSHPLLIRREFLTRYHGKGLPPGTGSYTFRYWLGAPTRTLTTADLDEFHNCFLAFLRQKGVGLR